MMERAHCACQKKKDDNIEWADVSCVKELPIHGIDSLGLLRKGTYHMGWVHCSCLRKLPIILTGPCLKKQPIYGWVHHGCR